LIVIGENFDQGATVLIDGQEQRTRSDDARPTTSLLGKKAARNIAPGQVVSIQVRNSDGVLSQAFSFTRLP
jgi:hypothetical protein